MNKSLHFGLTIFIVISCLFSNNAFGQTTTLGLGDIAFTGYQSDPPNKISFILLKPVTAGTKISFTDNGWLAGGNFRTFGPGIYQELVMSWTADVAYPCGTQIQLLPNTSESFAEDGTVAGTLVNPDISVLDNSPFSNAIPVNLSTSGDQLFAFQGPLPTAADMSGFLAAIQMNGTWQADATNVNTSARPAVFTDGVNSLFIDPQTKNASYACGPPQLVLAGDTPAEVAAMVNNSANWSLSSDADLDIPPNCDFVVCCTVLENLVSADASCQGADGTATIVASFCSLTGSYTVTGPVTMTNTTGVFTNLPEGNYTATVEDTTLPAGTCTDSQAFTVGGEIDVESPMVTTPLPPVTGLECGAALPAIPETIADFIALGGVVTDDCTPVADFSFSSEETEMGDFCTATNLFTVTRTFTITDAAGNSTMTEQTFAFLEDETGPMISCPANTTASCNGSTDPANTGMATATDNCSAVAEIVITFEDISSQATTSCEQYQYEIERTWLATDACGNSASCVQVIQVTDTEAPVITCLPNQTLSCFETIPVPMMNAADFIAGGGTISDNCATALGDFTVFSQNANNGADNCPGNTREVVRTYFVSDACGNVSTCTQTFTYLESTQGPVITSVLPTCYKYCSSLLNPMETDITYDTDCSFDAEVTITGPTQIGTDNCPGTIYRYAYTVTDDCGRTSAPVTRDFIIGNDGPTVTAAPFNLILECGNPDNQAYIDTHIGITTANSTCELDVTINHFPQTFNLVSCGSSTVVTFVATDACGRTASATTTIAVQDNTAPTFTEVPPSVCDVIECGADANFWFDHWIDYMVTGLVATDECDNNVSISALSPQLNTSCGADGKAISVVSFVATDNCSNSRIITGAFTIENTSPAIFTDVPANSTIDCSDALSFGTPTLGEECQTTLSFTDAVDDTNPCAVQYTRTWLATDACGGLTNTAAQTITVLDTDGPEFTNMPADATITCNETVSFGMPTVSDACTMNPTVDFVDTQSGSSCNITYTRTWMATDACGNMSTFSQNITATDTEGPIFTAVPGDYIGPCIDANGMVTAYAQICSSSDDAEEDKEDGDEGEMNLTSSDLELVLDNSQSKNVEVGLRFKDLNIPAGAQITAAHIQFFADATIDVDPSALTIHGEDSDNALTFTEEDFNISSRPKTSAAVDWEPGDWQVIGDNHEVERSPDLTTIVQEIVDRTGYTAQSALAFFINGTGKRTAIAYDLNPDQAPQLYVTYQAASDVFGMATATDDCTSDPNITFSDGASSDCAGSKIRTWIATDDCGNTTTATQMLSFTDDIPPVFTFVPTHVNGDCDTITFPPTFGNPVVADNCDPNTNITFTDFFYEGDTNSCADEVDYDYRRLWVATDACGNSTTAVQRFNINGTDYSSLSGFIFTEEEAPVEEVEVSLEGFNGFNTMSMSQGNGTFGYNSLNYGSNYTVAPKSNKDPLNGISTYDIVLMSRHILQIEALDSPYKIIAADINKSGSVTTFDLVELRKMILLINEEFENNNSWRFVESDYIFPDPTNPFNVVFPEETFINGLVEGEEHNYVGIKVGDVNNTAIPNSLMAVESRTTTKGITLLMDDAELEVGEEYEVIVRAEDFEAITGFQFALNFDATSLEFVDLSPAMLPQMGAQNFGLTKVNEGRIVSSWNHKEAVSFDADIPLFTLTFKAKTAVRLSKVLSMSNNSISAEAYDRELALLSLELRFEGDVDPISNKDYTLYQNQPNPFKTNTTIGFELPRETTATIGFYDLSGRLVKEVVGDFPKGYNEIAIDKSDLKGNGVLYYRLLTSDFEATKKMMVIE